MVSQFGKECLIQYIRGPLGGSRFPWKKKIFLYHLNHSVILEKCYIKITLTNYLCKINKLQTIPLFFSVILQVKDTDINGYLHYLDFRYVCVNVCVCVWGWGEGGGREDGFGQKHLYPPCLPSRGNTVSYLPKIYGKPCTRWQEFSLELSFEAQSSLQIIWSFEFSFCMYLQWKRLKSNTILGYFWHLSAYSIKSTRCVGMIYFHACSPL